MKYKGMHRCECVGNGIKNCCFTAISPTNNTCKAIIESMVELFYPSKIFNM